MALTAMQKGEQLPRKDGVVLDLVADAVHSLTDDHAKPAVVEPGQVTHDGSHFLGGL